MMAKLVKVRILTIVIAVWAFLSPTVVIAQVTTNSATAAAPSTLGELIPKIQAQSKLPPRLPTFLPDTGGQKIYALLRHADADSYDILLATKVPCEGGNACSYGTVQAQKSAFVLPEGKPTAIALGDRIMGQFFPAECHAFCGEAYVRWRENGIFYSIGIKAGKRTGLLRSARSALAQH
jgi:hypothetical protein